MNFITPQPGDVLHKAMLYRVLSGIADDAVLAQALMFKGGTCAAMLGYLDRFSVDLDFDYVAPSGDMGDIRTGLEKVFYDCGLTIADKSSSVPQYFLKYKSPDQERNTLKVDANTNVPSKNTYETRQFIDIRRMIRCQTRDTMVANKMVALMDRYTSGNHQNIAGRDVYDVHHFLMQGFSYNSAVIEGRTGKSVPTFLQSLICFVEDKVTDNIITQDLNTLIPYEQFKIIRKHLKQETLLLLKEELERISK